MKINLFIDCEFNGFGGELISKHISSLIGQTLLSISVRV